jgi:hypothetical protein
MDGQQKRQIDPELAAETIREKAAEFGKAKGDRVYLEEFRRSKKAMLMKDCLAMGIEAANAQEREALADPEYVSLLKGLAVAVENEETLKWQLEAARLEIEIWRTRQANERAVVRSHE